MGNNYKVYIHIFPNNKVYIGITRNRTDIRWANGKGYKSQKVMSNAINKYGWENIEHKVLYENLTKEEAEQKEIELIAYYKSNQRQYGYNIENGGNCVGKMSEETKKKISKSNIGKNTGIKNGMYGKHPKGEFKKGNIPHNKGKKTSEYLEGIKQAFSHLLGIATGPAKKQTKGNEDYTGSLLENADEIKFASIVFNCDNKKFDDYKILYESVFENSDVIKGTIKDVLKKRELKLTIVPHLLQYQEVFQANFLHEKVREFYRVANATSEKS